MTSKHELGEIIRDGELADGRRPDPPPENPPPALSGRQRPACIS